MSYAPIILAIQEYSERPKKLPFKKKQHIIAEIVANEFGINVDDMISRGRSRWRVEPRQICMCIMVKKRAGTLSDIGLFFGGFDHTTVVHSRDTVLNLCDTDEEYKERYDSILSLVNKKIGN